MHAQPQQPQLHRRHAEREHRLAVTVLRRLVTVLLACAAWPAVLARCRPFTAGRLPRRVTAAPGVPLLPVRGREPARDGDARGLRPVVEHGEPPAAGILSGPLPDLPAGARLGPRVRVPPHQRGEDPPGRLAIGQAIGVLPRRPAARHVRPRPLQRSVVTGLQPRRGLPGRQQHAARGGEVAQHRGAGHRAERRHRRQHKARVGPVTDAQPSVPDLGAQQVTLVDEMKAAAAFGQERGPEFQVIAVAVPRSLGPAGAQRVQHGDVAGGRAAVEEDRQPRRRRGERVVEPPPRLEVDARREVEPRVGEQRRVAVVPVCLVEAVEEKLPRPGQRQPDRLRPQLLQRQSPVTREQVGGTGPAAHVLLDDAAAAPVGSCHRVAHLGAELRHAVLRVHARDVPVGINAEVVQPEVDPQVPGGEGAARVPRPDVAEHLVTGQGDPVLPAPVSDRRQVAAEHHVGERLVEVAPQRRRLGADVRDQRQQRALEAAARPGPELLGQPRRERQAAAQVPVPLRPVVKGCVRLVEEEVLHGGAEVLAECLPERLVSHLDEPPGGLGHQVVRYPGRRARGRHEDGDLRARQRGIPAELDRAAVT